MNEEVSDLIDRSEPSQALEAAWRGLYFLVKRLDTDGGLKLFLLDVSRDELAADARREAGHDDLPIVAVLQNAFVTDEPDRDWAVVRDGTAIGMGEYATREQALAEVHSQ